MQNFLNRNEPSPGKFDPMDVALVEVPGKELMELTNESLTFVDPNGVKWTAPKGTWTDGASVPTLALWITDGRFKKEFLKAAILHDAYCQECNAERCPEQYQKKPWQDVHRMFYDACVAGNTPILKAKLMYQAVRLRGPKWDDPDRDLQIVDDGVLRAGIVDCKNWIEDNDPTLKEIDSWIDKREPTVIAVSKFQSSVISALDAENLTEAQAAQQRSEELLEKGLNESPNDLMLLNLKGYHHKNSAIIYSYLHRGSKVDEELSKAETIFKKIISFEPQDPSALNGLGSVMILRGNLDLALAEEYIHKALDIYPNYTAAQRDFELIKRLQQSYDTE